MNVHAMDSSEERISPFLISTFLFTCLLFYVDEGYYNFSWMFSANNWIVFFVYALPILVIQLCLYYLLRTRVGSKYLAITLSIILGILSGTSLVWYLLS